MNIQPSPLPGVLVLEPAVYGDARGWFMENWRRSDHQAKKHEESLEDALPTQFAQVNTSHSRRGVLRGLHYQWPEPQGKLVWVTHGSVFDVAVDIRIDSPNFGQWFGLELSAENHRQLWVPEGFAHGFQVLSETATFSYLCTRSYRAEYDAAIAWNDQTIGVQWPQSAIELSDKDRNAPSLEELSQHKEKLPRCVSC